MIEENLQPPNEFSNAADHQLPPGHHQGVHEMLSRPEIIGGIFVAVFVSIAGAIRFTRFSIKSTIESYHTYDELIHGRRKGTLSMILKKCSFLQQFKLFWGSNIIIIITLL